MKRALAAAALALTACDARLPVTVAAKERHALVPADLPRFFDCLRERGHTVISAHRGGPAPGRAENTVDAFAHTLSAAPAFMEVDVAATSDGALILMHDDTVDRTTTGTGRLGEMTISEVRALTVEDETGAALNAAPTALSDALAWAHGNTVLELDIKRSVRFEDVVREVEEAGAMGRVAFITYSVNAAARLAELAPEAMIYTRISHARELDALERRGVDLNRIVAWLGADPPPAGLVEALAARGVEARFGMFGEVRDFSGAARAGAQIVAVDDAAKAYRDLDAADGQLGYAALQCATMQNPTGRHDRWSDES